MVFDLTQFGSQQLSVEETDVLPIGHSCGLNTYKRYTYHVLPSLLTVFVAYTTTKPDKVVHVVVDGHVVHSKQAGVVYYEETFHVDQRCV